MKAEPYVDFDGKCEEAVQFYQQALGAEVLMMMRYSDAPPSDMMPPNSGNKIMHVSLQIGSTRLMGSDGSCSGKVAKSGISLSLGVDNKDDAARCFAALSEGGHITMPLSETFWTPAFGMLVDRFGVAWMVNMETEG